MLIVLPDAAARGPGWTAPHSLNSTSNHAQPHHAVLSRKFQYIPHLILALVACRCSAGCSGCGGWHWSAFSVGRCGGNAVHESRWSGLGRGCALGRHPRRFAARAGGAWLLCRTLRARPQGCDTADESRWSGVVRTLARHWTASQGQSRGAVCELRRSNSISDVRWNGIRHLAERHPCSARSRCAASVCQPDFEGLVSGQGS